MAVHGAFLTLCRRRRYHNNVTGILNYLNRNQRISTNAESVDPPELSGKNAYDLLGLSESCSVSEIKSSFRKLAKQTHPDLSKSPHGFSNSQRFLQILAAYEILSDIEKRAHYDRYLLSQKVVIQKGSKQGSAMYTYESYEATDKQMEVVEWLKWYRDAINDIVLEKRIMDGTGYFDELENDFYSAINAAYYGPVIHSMDFLPDCFEADERSGHGTPEVLHLVSGRDLFGKVCFAEKVLQLTHARNEVSSEVGYTSHGSETQIISSDNNECDAYKDLELHISGKVVAIANRVPPNSCIAGKTNDDSEDRIHVYINLHEDYISGVESNKDPEENTVVSKMFLGTITGLGTSGEEGYCSFHNNCGEKTHVIMIHRTLLVKHMHWFQLGDKASVCECRCTRARLPPSKYWLFEPRSGSHDIGGWYVETYGKDNKGKNVPSQRYWDGIDLTEPYERRVHPAIYLLALAYRTLDIEDTKRQKQTIRDIVEGKMSEVYNWCKKLI